MNIKYATIFIDANHKVRLEKRVAPIETLAKEAHHYGLKTAKDVIDRWDSMGRSYKKYRYFLLSENVNLKEVAW